MDQNRKDAVSSYLGRGRPTGLLLSGGIGFSGPAAKRAEPSQHAPATLRRLERASGSKRSQQHPASFLTRPRNSNVAPARTIERTLPGFVRGTRFPVTLPRGCVRNQYDERTVVTQHAPEL